MGIATWFHPRGRIRRGSLQDLRALVLGHLRRRGHLDDGGRLDPDAAADLDTLGTCHAAAIQGLIGMGSLRGVASWLPPLPFDLLHRLPGFVAVGIPSRFWGFVGLPLAIASAVALQRTAVEVKGGWRRHVLWAAVAGFTVGNVGYSLARPFLGERGRQSVPARAVPTDLRRIEYLDGHHENQSLALTPTRGLLDAYNHQDHFFAEVEPGHRLVGSTVTADQGRIPATAKATWHGWNTIIVHPPPARGRVEILLNQCYHPLWRSSAGRVERSPIGNLRLVLDATDVPVDEVALRFSDPASTLGVTVSAWSGLGFLLLLVIRLVWTEWGRRPRGPAIVSSRRSERAPLPAELPGPRNHDSPDR